MQHVISIIYNLECQYLSYLIFGHYFSALCLKRPWQTGYMESWHGPFQYLSPAPRLALLMEMLLQGEGKAAIDCWQSIPRLRDSNDENPAAILL